MKTRYLIITAIVIILVPICLNFLLPIKITSLSISGKTSEWFQFWSSYSGAIISGLITLWVLYKTLDQNQNNHITQLNLAEKLNRDQKEYHMKQQWNAELKKVLIENINVLDFRNLERISMRINIYESNQNLLDELSQLENSIKAIDLNLLFLYPDGFNTKLQDLYKTLIDKAVSDLYKCIDHITGYLIALEQYNNGIKYELEMLDRVHDKVTKSFIGVILDFQAKKETIKSDRKQLLQTLNDEKEQIVRHHNILKTVTVKLAKSEE